MSDEINTEWTSLPTCPHCGNEDNDWWDGTSLKNDGDDAIHHCGSCGKRYHVTLNITTEFTTKKVSEENDRGETRPQDSESKPQL